MCTWFRRRRALRALFAAHLAVIQSEPFPVWTVEQLRGEQ